MNTIRVTLLATALAAAASLHGQVITPASIVGSGTFYNSVHASPGAAAGVLIDGTLPPEMTNWQDPTFDGLNYYNGYNTSYFPAGTSNRTVAGGTTVWWAANDLSTGAANPVSFTIDLGGLYNLTGLTWSVDNNDGYYAQYSTDGVAFNSLFSINSSAGDISWGMDTISSNPGDPQYDAQQAFSPVFARYLRVGAVAGSGDGYYAMAEVQAFGTAIPIGAVPEPSTYGAIGAVVLLAGAACRRFRRR